MQFVFKLVLHMRLKNNKMYIRSFSSKCLSFVTATIEIHRNFDFSLPPFGDSLVYHSKHLQHHLQCLRPTFKLYNTLVSWNPSSYIPYNKITTYSKPTITFQELRLSHGRTSMGFGTSVVSSFSNCWKKLENSSPPFCCLSVSWASPLPAVIQSTCKRSSMPRIGIWIHKSSSQCFPYTNNLG